MNGELTIEFLSSCAESFKCSTTNKNAMNMVTTKGLFNSAKTNKFTFSDSSDFSIQLKYGGATDQGQSGRCWSFATLNLLRSAIIKRYNIDDFPLSNNFVLFYDKLEKSNYFLELILSTLKLNTGDRFLAYILQSPITDGGQWEMARNIIQKYGLVPEFAMPETISSMSTSGMNVCIEAKLKEFACTLRKNFILGATPSELNEMKLSMIAIVYKMLCVCLGVPPNRFIFDQHSIGDNHYEENLTPLEFYSKYICINLDEYINVVNIPSLYMQFNSCYAVRSLCNIVGGRTVRYINLPIEYFSDMAVSQLSDGIPVWFGCDANKFQLREAGIFDLKSYDFESLFDTKFSMTKGEQIEYGLSAITHSMVLQGVQFDKLGKPFSWLVENSCGKNVGKNGLFIMTNDWFEQYGYQIVIHKKFFPQELLEIYQGKPIMLEPWTPLGTLTSIMSP